MTAQNDKAARALQNLRNLGLIYFFLSQEVACVVMFIEFPTSISESIEEAYHDMFLYQNEDATFFYICQNNAWINPVSRWFPLWSSRFMMNPLAAWPHSVFRDNRGYPENIQDAFQNYSPLDFMGKASSRRLVGHTRIFSAEDKRARI